MVDASVTGFYYIIGRAMVSGSGTEYSTGYFLFILRCDIIFIVYFEERSSNIDVHSNYFMGNASFIFMDYFAMRK